MFHEIIPAQFLVEIVLVTLKNLDTSFSLLKSELLYSKTVTKKNDNFFSNKSNYLRLAF